MNKTVRSSDTGCKAASSTAVLTTVTHCCTAPTRQRSMSYNGLTMMQIKLSRVHASSRSDVRDHYSETALVPSTTTNPLQDAVVLTLTATTTGVPAYFSEHLVLRVVAHQKRSATLFVLTVPRLYPPTSSGIRFSMRHRSPGTVCWLTLCHVALNMLLRHLKTTLFNSCYLTA